MDRPGDNPYSAPAVNDLAPSASPELSEMETIRRTHLGREVTIQSIGGLAVLGGALYLIGLVLQAVTVASQGAEALPFLLIGMLINLLIAGSAITIGLLLRRLNPVARILYTVLSGLGLVMVGIVLIAVLATANSVGAGVVGSTVVVVFAAIPVLFLVLLWSGRSAMVFSRRYRLEIIPATPHIRYRTPLYLWIILGVIVLGVVGLIITALIR